MLLLFVEMLKYECGGEGVEFVSQSFETKKKQQTNCSCEKTV